MQRLSTWDRESRSSEWLCCESFLEGARVYILCTHLHCICFIRVFDGVVGLMWVAAMGRSTTKIENHCIDAIFRTSPRVTHVILSSDLVRRAPVFTLRKVYPEQMFVLLRTKCMQLRNHAKTQPVKHSNIKMAMRYTYIYTYIYIYIYTVLNCECWKCAKMR